MHAIGYISVLKIVLCYFTFVVVATAAAAVDVSLFFLQIQILFIIRDIQIYFVFHWSEKKIRTLILNLLCFCDFKTTMNLYNLARVAGAF